MPLLLALAFLGLTSVRALECTDLFLTLSPDALTQCDQASLRAYAAGQASVDILVLPSASGSPALRNGKQTIADVSPLAGYSVPISSRDALDFQLPLAAGTTFDVFLFVGREGCAAARARTVGPGSSSCALIDLAPMPVPPPSPRLPPSLFPPDVTPVIVPSPPLGSAISAVTSIVTASSTFLTVATEPSATATVNQAPTRSGTRCSTPRSNSPGLQHVPQCSAARADLAIFAFRVSQPFCGCVQA
jgi:hypothetical protein